MRYKVYSPIKGIPFSKENSKESWELLRKKKHNNPYGIEGTVLLYEKNCNKQTEYKKVAAMICRYLKNSVSIVSCGVGKGMLEWHIKRLLPKSYLCCTDYTAEALVELKKVFVLSDEFKVFDIKNDNWEELNRFDVVLLYRVNTDVLKNGKIYLKRCQKRK